MVARELPSQERLRELFDYDPQTGKLTWKERPAGQRQAHCVGREAFTAKSDKGYRRGNIGTTQYRAHRLIYKWWHGEEPEEVDHINGIRDDNRISNLRPSNRRGNMRNLECHRSDPSRIPCTQKVGDKWMYRVFWKGECHFVSGFDTAQAAKDAMDAFMAS